MRNSKVYFIQVDRKVNNDKWNDFFEKIYESNIKNQIFVNTKFQKGKLYECWSFHESFFKLDEQNYLIKLNSYGSPNDIAGFVHHFLDKNLNVIAIDLNVDETTYPPVGLKFSNLSSLEYEAITFIESIYGFKDIRRDDFFYKTKKKELIDLVKNNNLHLWNFTDEILDEIDKLYYSNEAFDPKALEEINKEFIELFVLAHKAVRDIFRF